MAKIKTSELIGPALDWAVAKCEGVTKFGAPAYHSEAAEFVLVHESNDLNYSTDWSQGGPIGERERIHALPDYEIGKTESGHEFKDFKGWKAVRTDRPYWQTVPTLYGPTELIAKMRCYVASKLGDEIEVPDELLS